MNVHICIGSSCYLKGSKDIITILERLITIHNVKDKVTLMGSFCMGHCTEGVCVTIDDTIFSFSYLNLLFCMLGRLRSFWCGLPRGGRR